MSAVTSHAFKEAARRAIADENLRQALTFFESGFSKARVDAIARLPEFERLRQRSREIKDHVLDNLDYYLERFEKECIGAGGQVHWCRTAAEAREKVLEICRDAGARTVTKGKTMIAEEIGLNPYLEEHGIAPIETDLGEYIIQLADEPPSHIIAPAVHKTQDQVSDLFLEHHAQYGKHKRLTEGPELLAEAREVLRQKYLDAEVGITGANFLIAETGTSVIVTNEGNGDLTQTLPKVHIVLASLEKVVPTLEDATTIMRVLARSATGQEMSVYTTFSTGPRRPEDLDGPEAYHVILLDNGRGAMLGSEFRDILRCIRCGACMNVCPVFAAVGGHAYGATYVGPMGAVLTPALEGLAEAHHLPNASSFCGRCESVCPMEIPLPKLMRHWRERAYADRIVPGAERLALSIWAWFAKRPAFYRLGAGLGVWLLAWRGGARGRHLHEPVAPAARLPRGGVMATGRDRILGDIRRSLGRGALSADAGRELGARLKAHKANLIPARARGSAEELVARFVDMAEAADATVARVGDAAAVPAAVADYLAEHNLPTRLVVAPDARLDAMPWAERPLLELRRGAAEETDAVSLTPAFAGIAETGTLMLMSGAETPTTLNFLPETHVVVLAEEAVVGAYEDAWTRLRKARKEGRGWSMPRTVNLITGPSRSGDIGLTLHLGAHGPRRLHIVLVAEGA